MGWAMVAVVVWLSLTPSPPEPPAFLEWDKLQHFLAYGCLMYWFGMSFDRHWRWPIFLVALGIGLEFLQGFGGVRVFDPLDMIANSIGVMAGLLAAISLLGGLLGRVDGYLANFWKGHIEKRNRRRA